MSSYKNGSSSTAGKLKKKSTRMSSNHRRQSQRLLNTTTNNTTTTKPSLSQQKINGNVHIKQKRGTTAVKPISDGIYEDIIEEFNISLNSSHSSGDKYNKTSISNTVKVWKHGTLSRDLEQQLGWSRGLEAVAGVDEAGRGPLAGPVVAAAVIIPQHVIIDGVHDSKLLKEEDREELFMKITQHRDITWSISIVGHEVIDDINILQATMTAMRNAVMSLSKIPDLVLVDGNRVPSELPMKSEFVVGGDGKSFAIAAASVLAKVVRDRIMCHLHTHFPKYGLNMHKGYGTAAHIKAIRCHGPSGIHRMTFRPNSEWN